MERDIGFAVSRSIILKTSSQNVCTRQKSTAVPVICPANCAYFTTFVSLERGVAPYHLRFYFRSASPCANLSTIFGRFGGCAQVPSHFPLCQKLSNNTHTRCRQPKHSSSSPPAPNRNPGERAVSCHLGTPPRTPRSIHLPLLITPSKLTRSEVAAIIVQEG